MSTYTLNIAGCKHTTKDLIQALVKRGFKINLVITLTPEVAEKNKVAGYMDLRPFLQEVGIDHYLVESYSLKSEKDKSFICSQNLGVLLCMGWQRLIPEWFLQYLKVGAFGMHGSNKPLPHGRGRSPLNWSLIQGKRMFFTHFFQYKPGVDDGDVVAYQLFDITAFDTAHTLHLKNLLSMVKLCEKYLPQILENKHGTFPQPKVEPSYYPKRTEEDGIIFWEDSSEDIYNLIRAVTKPFPGAFCFCGDEKIRIWKAVPFDSHIRWDHLNPGQLCEVLYDGSFIVKTGDTSILVTDYEGVSPSNLNQVGKLHSNNTERKQWPNLPK